MHSQQPKVFFNRKESGLYMEYALVTGGTSGIGYELARCFAADGYGIVLVSSNETNLNSVKEKFQKEFDIRVQTIVQDLSRPKAALMVHSQIKEMGIYVTALVNCAGFGTVGPTDKIDAQKDEAMLQLNVISLVEMCKLFLPDMYRAGNGGILNVASTGAFQPGPYTSTYYASKSFVLSYSRAIRYEAARHNVNVSTLCPGTTRTEFFKKEGMKTPFYAVSAKSVARYAYRRYNKNREVIVPGIMNKLMRILPIKIKVAGIAKMKEQSDT